MADCSQRRRLYRFSQGEALMLGHLTRETRFLVKDRGALFWLLLAFVLSVVAVSFGIAEVREQRETIAALIEEDAADRANALEGQEDWGSAAYYAFHLTYAPPSDFAFAAMGQRDSSPWKHRVRMLALEGQIHEADTRNADFGLVGRFDFAFLAASVAPLLLILLLYDLRASERTMRRHDLLVATAGSSRSMWLPRAFVRVTALALLLLVPLWVGAMIEGTAPSLTLQASGIVLGSLLVWWLIVELVSRIDASPSILLTSLIGLWLALAIVVPAISKAAIEASNPVPDGGEILLLQRETVNDAWDLPKESTMEPFVERHPEYADHSEIGEQGFEWKWYYAFQQVGDQVVEPLATQYREARLERDTQAGLASWLSPTSLVERAFERMAGTDAGSMIAYENKVRDYHGDLRGFYYPLMFPEVPYDKELLSGLPAFAPPL
jgi:ABC-2 type transport system permease protein